MGVSFSLYTGDTTDVPKLRRPLPVGQPPPRTSGGGGGDRFGFTAREHDEGTNLRAHRYRYADPETGRWTQEDPIGFAAGDANLYRYVGNGPTNATDPIGLEDHGEQGGRIHIDPDFDDMDLDIRYIDEDYEATLKPDQDINDILLPLPPAETTDELLVDAVIIPGVGMFKIRNGSEAYLTNDPRTGKPTVITIEKARRNGIPVENLFFPIGKPNPFRIDIPGDDVDESKLPIYDYEGNKYRDAINPPYIYHGFNDSLNDRFYRFNESLHDLLYRSIFITGPSPFFLFR